MVHWDAWYSRISRLTLDGAGRAAVALLYGPAFSTYNETSDLIFRDAKTGLLFGEPKSNGQAENAVLRCQFLRCETGTQTVNWNSMDIWVWDSRFEECQTRRRKRGRGFARPNNFRRTVRYLPLECDAQPQIQKSRRELGASCPTKSTVATFSAAPPSPSRPD
jgi:hypothetical protein